ncbi:hypothetical protein OG906_37800 (plasmid) [Streptomyces sp. NBC_01426]|uniref:hypothetical protein n=1 Tax=unclassified Streptomyces TaxID=2593676 RepID=UPI002E3348E9|nr:hypothetical protein [Streptomyces sp. NBC_01426]
MSSGVDQRFHLDQDGHSITVVRDGGGRRVELLVDGRVVAAARTRRHAPTELSGSLARGGSEDPLSFVVRLGRGDIPGGEPLCALEIEGQTSLMPFVPLTPRERWADEPDPSPSTPAQLLARWRAHRAGR